MALNLIMFGPPGAGKGTQAEQFAKTRGIPKISTGDILREAVHAGTEIGRQAQVTMGRGDLVSDDVMIGIVRDRLDRDDASRGFVLDGFPRTLAQATALDQMMSGRDPLIVVEIVVPEDQLIRRLSMRLVCDLCGSTAVPGGSKEKCGRCGGGLVQRTDDNVDVVRERLNVYHRLTEPLVEYYSRRPTFRSVNGAQAADRVSKELVTAIESAGTGLAAVEGAR
jgi:adenylate kinase